MNGNLTEDWPMWCLVGLFSALSTYCFLAACFPVLPMLKWGAYGAPRVPMSAAGRIAVGIAVSFFAAAPLILDYRPSLFPQIGLVFIIDLAGTCLIGLRDWRRHRNKS